MRALLLIFATEMALADPTVVRIATAAPDGSTWAREFRAYAAQVAQETKQRVRIKFYFGGIAGDENEVSRRIAAGQLDGIVSGGAFCNRVAPSMRVVIMPGAFWNRDEVTFVLNMLLPTLRQEAHRAGFTLLGTASLGPALFFTRRAVRDYAELSQVRLAFWDIYDASVLSARAMGLSVVPLSVADTGKAFETGRIDGMVYTPLVVLAFQWTSEVRNLVNLPLSFPVGCILVANRGFDRIATVDRQAMEAESAGLVARVEEAGHSDDALLLGGLFEKQGVHTVPVTAKFRAEFFEAARRAREQLGTQLASPELQARVAQALADYRAEHAR